MKNRHTKPKENRNKEKTESRQNLDDKSPAKNLLKLLFTISNQQKSTTAEKAIRQSIADLIIDNICNSYEYSLIGSDFLTHFICLNSSFSLILSSDMP